MLVRNASMMNSSFLCCIYLMMLTAPPALTKPGYLFTAPKSLQKGTNETFCFTFHDLYEAIDVKIRIVENVTVHSEADYVFDEGKGRCIQFPIPLTMKSNKKHWEEHEVEIIGKSLTQNYNFMSRAFFRIVDPSTNLIFVQTDKPMFKPSQTIRFRMIVLDIDLRPIRLPIEKDDMIHLEDPRGIRMMEWKNMSTKSGLVTFEFPLSEDPILGTWKLVTKIGKQSTKTNVVVSKYVLPKFEVTVTPPHYVTPLTPVVPVTVCARYTYGQPVKGTVMIRVCLVTRRYYCYRRRDCQKEIGCQLYYGQISGCHDFLVEGAKLGLPYKKYRLWSARIQIKTTVTENGTGISLHGHATVHNIQRQELKLSFLNTEKYYKPGLPFLGKVKISRLDDKSAPGEAVEISLQEGSTERFKEVFTSDNNGVIYFTIPPLNNSATYFILKATAIRYKINRKHWPEKYHPMDMPSIYHNIQPWYSPSNSYLEIHPMQKSLKCGQKVSVNLTYTTFPNSVTTFYYQVTNRGHLIDQGHIKHNYGGEDGETNTNPGVIIGDLPVATNDASPVFPPSQTEKTFTDKINEAMKKFKQQDKAMSDKFTKATETTHFQFEITVDARHSPKAKLVVYHVTNDHEIVADSVVMDVDQCFSNEVHMEFSSDKVKPGGNVSLQLSAKPNSLCSIGVVDKSILLLGGDNQLTPDKVFKEAAKNDPVNYYYSNWRALKDYCAKKYGNPKDYFDSYSIQFDSKYADSVNAFRDLSLVTLSDMLLETKPCYLRHVYYYSPINVAEMGPRGAGFARRKLASRQIAKDGQAKESQVRKHFPETWLWEIEEVGPSGELVLDKKAPDTITNFVGNALCTNHKDGFGISNKDDVTVFKPVFVSFTLPYSIIRGEEVPFTITVFNYLDSCLNIELEVEQSEQFFISGPMRSVHCVCGGESFSQKLSIVATEIGTIPIKAKAQSTDKQNVCPSDKDISKDVTAHDAMIQKLLVEAEGIPKVEAISSFICLKGSSVYSDMRPIDLPPVVPDSVRAYLTVHGDVMGGTLNNLGNLVRLPGGCGEQTASSLAPNIYVMQYLSATKNLKDNLKNQLINNMQHGYQRMLGFRNESGAYSVWRGGSPSLWLTLFTVKSLSQASKFIFVDDGDLELSLRWIFDQQLDNGCMPRRGYFHAWRWAEKSQLRGDVVVTAYTVIAALESGQDKDNVHIVKAISCLKNMSFSDSYSTAIVAYAFSLYDHLAPYSAKMKSKLMSMVVKEDELLHWERKNMRSSRRRFYRYYSAEVEMTSYALLALLTQGVDRVKVIPIVRWLTQQRNPYGGFSSTQDTVVALQALAQFGKTISSDKNDLTISVRNKHETPEKTESFDFKVSASNKLILQKERIKNLGQMLEVQATGSGCALFQAQLMYNINEDKPSTPSFTLTHQASSAVLANDTCNKRKLRVCTKYIGTGAQSGMAILEVNMMTGWRADEPTVAHNLKMRELNIQKYEIAENNAVVFYFDKVKTFDHCVEFIVNEYLVVNNSKDAVVKVYDYYDQEMKVIQLYNLGDCLDEHPVYPPFVRRLDALHPEPEPGSNMTKPQTNVSEPDLRVKAVKIIKDNRIIRTTPRSTYLPGFYTTTGPPCIFCHSGIPANLKNIFCSVKYAYKSISLPNNIFEVKVDVRPMTKQKIRKKVRYNVMEACHCRILKKARLVLILTDQDLTSRELKLKKGTVVIPFIKGMERQLKVFKKQPDCQTIAN